MSTKAGPLGFEEVWKLQEAGISFQVISCSEHHLCLRDMCPEELICRLQLLALEVCVVCAFFQLSNKITEELSLALPSLVNKTRPCCLLDSCFRSALGACLNGASDIATQDVKLPGFSSHLQKENNRHGPGQYQYLLPADHHLYYNERLFGVALYQPTDRILHKSLQTQSPRTLPNYLLGPKSIIPCRNLPIYFSLYSSS